MSTFDTPGPIVAVIELGMGDLQVHATDRTTTEVVVEPTDPSSAADRRAADEVRVELVDGRLEVRAPKLRSWLTRRTGAVDVSVDLPTGSDLDVSVGWADARADGPLGDVRVRSGLGRVVLDDVAGLDVKTGSGELRVGHVAGRVDVTSGSGRVRVEQVAGRASIRNSNGDTWVGTADDEVRVHTANGSIAIDLARGDVEAKSANGSIRVAEVVRGTVSLATQVGDLEVGIRPGTAAWLDCTATAGRVRNDLDAAEAPDTSTETVEVRARTTMGDVLVRRVAGTADAR